MGPPLQWEATVGPVRMTSSALTGELPGIEVPPVCIATLKPYLLAISTRGAASAGDLTEPSPISPTSHTPSRAISAKSASTSPCSRISAPP